MANENKPAKAGNNAAQGAVVTKSLIETLINATLTTSKAALGGLIRNGEVVNATVADFEKMSVGIGQTALAVGELFRIKGLRKVKQKINGNNIEAAIFIVENVYLLVRVFFCL